MVAHSPQFTYIPEYGSDFLDLFPHRHSYLWAEHPRAGERPDWQSEDRHPLSDRLLLQGAYLYGIRFGKITHYLMLDVDARSRYHPHQDPFAITRLTAALEPLGLTHYVCVTSSYSGGLHLYFPFVMGQASWAIANAAAALLESSGFVPTPGQLELFPNPRRYSESATDFNGHRLPLQNGSYLVNSDYEPIYTTPDRFVEQWRFAQSHNSVRREDIDRILKQFERRRWMFIKHKAQKFLNDLNAEIEPGWTSLGQTNRLLGRIAIREYVFFHILHNSEPLTGIQLQTRILEVALKLPGFRRWSRHQDDLPHLVVYWANCVERSPRYYPYGGQMKEEPEDLPEEPTINQQRSLDARDRIQAAVEELQQAGQFPAGIRARHLALKSKGIGSDTLYRYKDLWHGEKQLESAPQEMIRAISKDLDDPQSPEPAPGGVIRAIAPISFMCDRDCPSQGANPDAHTEKTGGSGGFSTATAAPVGVEHVRAALASIRRHRRKPAPIAGPPPDEVWFQLQLGGGQD